MRRISLPAYGASVALMLLVLLMPLGCRRGDTDKKTVAVSFDSQRWLVEQIAGEDFETVVLMPSGSDPEMFDPDMKAMRGLEKADIYLTTSTLGFETQLGRRISENYPQLEVADLSEGVEILMHTHSIAGAGEEHDHDGHDHARGEACEAGDPHILSSLRNTRIVARNILAALTRLNPERSELYCHNFAKLDERLSRSDAVADSLIKASGRTTFVTMHPILGYYARDYGLTQIPLEVDGKEASPRQLKERLDEAWKRNPSVLFYERGHNEQQAIELAHRVLVHEYPLQLNGEDFVSEIESVASIFVSSPRYYPDPHSLRPR